ILRSIGRDESIYSGLVAAIGTAISRVAFMRRRYGLYFGVNLRYGGLQRGSATLVRGFFRIQLWYLSSEPRESTFQKGAGPGATSACLQWICIGITAEC